jgi:uncharacterized damage-inducible protein DinB
MNLSDLVRYNHAVRERYLDALSKLPWEEVVKPRGLSFDSARNVFLHLTLVEDRWINFILPNRFSEWEDPDFEAYQSMSALKDYAVQVRLETERFLMGVTLNDLNRRVNIPWDNTPNTKITLETCLTHMVMEDMLHYGELSAMLWQMNLEAPYLAFWRFIHESSQSPR